MANRSAMFVVLVVIATGLVGCQAGAGGGELGQMVQVGSTKAGLIGPPLEFRTVHLRLEKMMDSRVVFRAQPDGAALADQLRLGNIHYAFLSGHEFCSIPNMQDLTVVAGGVNSLGRPSRKAHIVIKANSHLKGIEDCKSKRFAFGFHGDLLTDIAAKAALENAGVPVKSILPEVLPPPLAVGGRLYRGHDVAKTIVGDLTVNAGVIDEIDYNKMPDSGGNFITGPSKDQLEIVGETVTVPEMVVLAGPQADPDQTQLFKAFLLNELKNDERACKELEVAGFVEFDGSGFDAARALAASSE